jgi:3alpha(or 20beta)-hydroxysteroid dehydrogenase
MGRLDGKVAIISGAARGQGAAEARAFAGEGASVLIGDVLDELGRDLAGELGTKAIYQHLDVTSPHDWHNAVERVLDRWDRIDVLVNNAGVVTIGTIEDQPDHDFRRALDVNLVGCWYGMKAVIPAMKAARDGVIINVSSTSGMEGTAGLGAYTASKFAVRGLTKVAALELGPYNIRVNSVHPAGIDTPMTNVPGVDVQALFGAFPLRRPGHVDEVARLMLYLAADATYSTGSEFVIDGGHLAGDPFAVDEGEDR